MIVLAAVAWRQTSYWRNARHFGRTRSRAPSKMPWPTMNCAHCFTAQGKTEEAIAELREAVAAGSIDRQLIADCHDFLGASLMKQGKGDEALEQYEQAVRVYPENAMFHARLAVMLNREEQFKRAVVEFREIMRLNPAFPQARLGLADALLASGEAAEAVAVGVARSSSKSPTRPAPWSRWGPP